MEYSDLDLIQNDVYLLCPLNPQWCAWVRLYSKKKGLEDLAPKIVLLDETNTCELNRMIYRASDKIVIIRSESDTKYFV